jgi:hypothetical protein
MKKLTLKVDDLQVSSFETEKVRGRSGTVLGAANTTPNCPRWSEFWTCGIWCPETTDPQPTAPCQCPVDSEAPVC